MNLDDCAHAEPPGAAQRAADERRAAVRRVFLLTLGLNAAVAIVKAGYGWTSGSLTLGTDSLHSALDASSNVLHRSTRRALQRAHRSVRRALQRA